MDPWTWTAANMSEYLLDHFKKNADAINQDRNHPNLIHTFKAINEIQTICKLTQDTTDEQETTDAFQPSQTLTSEQAESILQKAELVPPDWEINPLYLSIALKNIIIKTNKLPRETAKQLSAISHLLDLLDEDEDPKIAKHTSVPSPASEPVPDPSPNSTNPPPSLNHDIYQLQSQASSPPLSDIPPTPPRIKPEWLQEAEITAELLDDTIHKNCSPTHNTTDKTPLSRNSTLSANSSKAPTGRSTRLCKAATTHPPTTTRLSSNRLTN
jgi:hypothetical protein